MSKVRCVGDRVRVKGFARIVESEPVDINGPARDLACFGESWTDGIYVVVATNEVTVEITRLGWPDKFRWEVYPNQLKGFTKKHRIETWVNVYASKEQESGMVLCGTFPTKEDAVRRSVSNYSLLRTVRLVEAKNQ